MEAKRISPLRLSDILKDTAGSRTQPTPRLALIRHKVEPSSLQGALVVHIKQTSNSTFKVVKGFPSVGVKLDSDLCTIRGGRSRGVSAFGRLQAYAAVLIEDNSGNRFYLTLDAIGDLRSSWAGRLSLHSSLSLASLRSRNFHSLQLDSLEPDSPKPNFPKLDLDSLKLLSLESEFLAVEKRKEYLLAQLAHTYLTPRNRESKKPCPELRDVVPGMTITAKWRWSSSQNLNMVLIECY
jgi:hypothetical protein